MPRPVKARRICGIPRNNQFVPLDDPPDREVVMTLEEYETIRLIDYLDCTQEECAAQMGVARTTVQAVYTSARQKLADVLIHGYGLKIAGGNYTVCPEARGCCRRNCQGRKCSNPNYRCGKQNIQEAADMKIAVTYSEGNVFQHFGHSEQFKLYKVEEGMVVSSEVIGTDGNGHGALAGFLQEKDVEVLICGGIGGGARTALSEAGIKLYPGASGNADEAVEALLKGTLSYDPDTMCTHHHEGEGQGHSCHGGHGGTCH